MMYGTYTVRTAGVLCALFCAYAQYGVHVHEVLQGEQHCHANLENALEDGGGGREVVGTVHQLASRLCVVWVRPADLHRLSDSVRTTGAIV